MQMLWGKLYAIWDPMVAQSVIRSRHASFDPIILERANDSLGLSPSSFAKVTDNPTIVRDYISETHKSFSKYHMREMSARALDIIAETFNILNDTDEGSMIPNLYIWLRGILSVATYKALLGKENPFDKDPSLIDDLRYGDDSPSIRLLNTDTTIAVFSRNTT